MVLRQALVTCLLDCTREAGWVVACSEASSLLFKFAPTYPTTGHSFSFILSGLMFYLSIKPISYTYCHPVTKSCLTLWDPKDCSTSGFPVLHYLLEFAQTHVHGVDDAIQPSHPLSSLLPLPSIFPSIRIFSNESVLRIRWPKYWSFSFSISPSNEYSGLISFRIDWFDLLAVQGTLKSLLQHHSSKAPSLWSNSYICT